MKVKIGPYKNWFGCYQLADLLCFWVKDVKDEYGCKSKPEWVHNFGTWLSGGEDRESFLQKFFIWVESKRKRNITVRIDKYDTWSMDNTLAYIIVPMLKQLKESKNGAPFVDDEDVPEELRSTSAPPKKEEYDIDDNHFKRWDYVLDEMIFAFERKVDDGWESEFHSGIHDTIWIPVDADGNEVNKEDAKFHRMESGPNDTHKFDLEGYKKITDRMQNGFLLFGKYYNNLWD